MSDASLAALEFLIPGDPATRTGGYRYDARLVAGLRETGLNVNVTRLSHRFPFPDAAALAQADAALDALPPGALVMIDGLAFGAMGDVARLHARRLRLIPLVHHPLALETGLSAEQAAALETGERQALGCAARVLVTSETTARSVAALGVPAHRITVAEPGCDPAPLAHGSARAMQHGGPVAPCRLLCVATLTPRKGHVVLIEALARLQRRRAVRAPANAPAEAASTTLRRDDAQTQSRTCAPAVTADGDWQLHCVGSTTRDPDTAAGVVQLRDLYGLGDRVVLHGEVDEPGLETLYASADVFVCASWWEGYGMAITEALAHGLPIITTTGGALAHTAPEPASLRVAPGDVDALSAAIEHFLDDPALRGRLFEAAQQARQGLPRWSDTVRTVRTMLAAVAR